ncbi:hypothetical protein SH528x_004467 [Novipirellula sp. SH528]|uniref:hypothetical protein n=1 Tax=Novipirellula sp. SH528 TaxID=3454466 RepID=UPI003F9EF615
MTSGLLCERTAAICERRANGNQLKPLTTAAPSPSDYYPFCFSGMTRREFFSVRKAYAAHTMQAAVTAIAKPKPSLVAGGAGKSKQTSK